MICLKESIRDFEEEEEEENGGEMEK